MEQLHFSRPTTKPVAMSIRRATFFSSHCTTVPLYHCTIVPFMLLSSFPWQPQPIALLWWPDWKSIAQLHFGWSFLTLLCNEVVWLTDCSWWCHHIFSSGSLSTRLATSTRACPSPCLKISSTSFRPGVPTGPRPTCASPSSGKKVGSICSYRFRHMRSWWIGRHEKSPTVEKSSMSS